MPNIRTTFAVIYMTLTAVGLVHSGEQHGNDSLNLNLPDEYDHYGKISWEDEKKLFLDKFAISLKKEPDAKGHIIAYGGRLDTCAGEAEARARRAKSYLVEKQGIVAERLVMVDGGYREDLEIYLFLVPHGEVSPIATPTVLPEEVQTIECCKTKPDENYSQRPRRKRR